MCRGWGFTNTSTCPLISQTCKTPPEVKCSFHGCSSVPGKESKFSLVQNNEDERIAKNSEHTIVCGDTNNVLEHTGVFISKIDNVDISAADIDDATEIIENIIKSKGSLNEDNHKMSNHITMECSGYDDWKILSDQFQ